LVENAKCLFRLFGGWQFLYLDKYQSIVNCLFHGMVDFSFGGHNDVDSAIQIKSTIFNDFVNFFDCQFGGDVV